MDNETTGALAKAAEALAEPLRLAVEKISGGVRRLHDPRYIRNIARANADAAFLKAVSDKDIEELSAAYENKNRYNAARKYLNLQLIADQVSEQLHNEDSVEATPPDDDWVETFCSNAENASSDGMRQFWSRIYASETKKPGLIPRRSLRKLRDFDHRLAVLFGKLSSCTFGGKTRFMVTPEEWGSKYGFDFYDLRKLEEVGIIGLPPIAQNSAFDQGFIEFFDRVIEFRKVVGEPTRIQMLALTRLGEALYKVSDPHPNEAYFEDVLKKFDQCGVNYRVLRRVAGGLQTLRDWPAKLAT